MNLSWLSIALALAVTVSAGVLRDVSPVKQLAARQGSVNTQITTTQTVTTYFQTSTTALQTCNSQISTETQAQVAVTTITTTVQTIQNQFPNVRQCSACGNLGRDDNFQNVVVALFTELQTVIETVNLRFGASINLFQPCWDAFNTYLGRVQQLSVNIQLNLSVILRGVLNVNLLSGIGINLNILGIGLGINLRD